MHTHLVYYTVTGVDAVFKVFCSLPHAASSQPLNLTSTAATDATISLQWSPPDMPNGIITNYKITYNAMTINTTDDSTTFTLMGLDPFTNHTISVAALNGAGVGLESDSIVVRTEEGS